jgi:hypothetical protein
VTDPGTALHMKAMTTITAFAHRTPDSHFRAATEAKLGTAFPETVWAIGKLQNNGLTDLHKNIGYGDRP